MKSNAAKTDDNFALSSPTPGKVPAGVVEELRRLRTSANEASTELREAIKVQADKHKVKPAALRRYVNALASDKVDEARKEAEDLESLIGLAPAA